MPNDKELLSVIADIIAAGEGRLPTETAQAILSALSGTPDEELERRTKGIPCGKGVKMDTYTIKLRCLNCGQCEEVEIPRGETVFEFLTFYKCPNCGCQEMRQA